MTPSRVVEAVDVLKQGQITLASGVARLPPNQFGFQRFEEGLDDGFTIVVSLTAHRDLEAVLFQQLLVIVRAILASTVPMMDTAFGWLAQINRHLQGTHCQIFLQPVADGPADDEP